MKPIIFFLINIFIFTNLGYSTLTDGLVAFYPLDNISKLNSTIGLPNTLSEGPFGVIQNNEYIYITRGQQSYIETPNNTTTYAGLGHTKNWSISLWFFTEDLSSNSHQCLWRQDGGDASNQHSPVRLSSSNGICLLGVDGATQCTQSVTQMNQWYNYIIIHQYINTTHSNWTLALDGSVYSQIGDENSATTGYLRFGDYSGSGGYNLEGGLRDIAIYNRTLTLSEIGASYLSNGTTSGITRYLPTTPANSSILIEQDTFTVSMQEKNNSLTSCTLNLNGINYPMNIVNGYCEYEVTTNPTTTRYDFYIIYNTLTNSSLQLDTRTIISYKHEISEYSGIVAYFPLDNISKLDSTINGHSLTSGPYGVVQNEDYVYITRGQQSYLITETNNNPYEGLAKTKNWTISMWFFTEDLDSNSHQCLWRQDGGDSTDQHSPFTNGADRICLYSISSGTCTDTITQTNVWYNYVISHEYLNSTHSNWTIWLNNASNNVVIADQSATTGLTRFGDYSGSGGYNLEGGLRDIIIYNKILKQSDIESIQTQNGSLNITLNSTLINNLFNSNPNYENSQSPKNNIFPFQNKISILLLIGIFLNYFIFFN